jgi:hypothetical protein
MTRVVLCFALLALPLQGRVSILDTARRNGGSVLVTVDIDSPVGVLSDVIPESDLIVRGIVQSVTPRISDDERIVVTEYEITPTRFYKRSSAQSAATPGATVSLVVQQPGGTMIVDNLLLKTDVNEFPEGEFLTKGEDVVLFLSPIDRGRFRLQSGPFGAFRVLDGNVRAMTQIAATRRHDEAKTIAEFEREMLGYLRK